MAVLVCEICDYESSEHVIIARWHDIDVCLDCLAHKEEMDAAEAASDRCACLDCLRYAAQHQGEQG